MYETLHLYDDDCDVSTLDSTKFTIQRVFCNLLDYDINEELISPGVIVRVDNGTGTRCIIVLYSRNVGESSCH